jgi:hypothetical protein
MNVLEFERHIRHLDQLQVLTGAINSLNKLLVEKRIVDLDELQSHFLAWLEEHDLAKPKRRKPSSRRRR